jgi:hypothetical protein
MTRQTLLTNLILLAFAVEGVGQTKAAITKAANSKAADEKPEEQNLETYMSLLRQDVRTQKVAIISQMMNFTPEDASKFWPIYSEYSKELRQIGDEKIAGIKQFAAAWPNMSDVQIDEIAGKALDLEARTTELKKKYYTRFKQHVSTKAAGKFLQIENQLLGLMNLQVAASLPIVE